MPINQHKFTRLNVVRPGRKARSICLVSPRDSASSSSADYLQHIGPQYWLPAQGSGLIETVNEARSQTTANLEPRTAPVREEIHLGIMAQYRRNSWPRYWTDASRLLTDLARRWLEFQDLTCPNHSPTTTVPLCSQNYKLAPTNTLFPRR